MPAAVAVDHEPVFVLASQFGPVGDRALREGTNPDPAELLALALEALAREASRRACVAVYAVRHQMTVDDGLCYITVTGTGARPAVDPDGPPGGVAGA